jgi:hypothetical protein
VLKSSFDEEFDGETDLLMAAVGMVNEDFLLLPPCRGGSSKKRSRPRS